MIVEFLVQTVQLYASVGLIFALAFVWRGAATIDPVAKHATMGFRLLMLPGAALFWPLFAHRWWKAALTGAADVPGDHTERWQPNNERLRSAALIIWMVLAPVLVAVLLVAAFSRRGEAAPTSDAARLPVVSTAPSSLEIAR